MTLIQRAVVVTLRGLTRLLCRIHDAPLARVPGQGPLILVSNHINFLEVPLLYAHLQPRPVIGFAKVETWDNPFLAWLFNLAGAVPLRRGEADAAALRRGLELLAARHIFAIAPEGTRSGHGRLQRGHPGVVMLALHSGAPLLPLVFYGGEDFWRNLIRLRRTDFHIVVGQPFYVEAGGTVTRGVRQQIVDEIMYQIAALLPPAYRGHYGDLGAAAQTHLRFPDAPTANVGRPAKDPASPQP